MEEQDTTLMTNAIKWLTCDPLEIVRRYSRYIVNEIRFHKKTCERCLKTQNNDIVVIVKTLSYAGSHKLIATLSYMYMTNMSPILNS